jgi:hypothetical protein
MPDTLDLRHTIVPKSDQLNADQLVGGPITVTVTGVSAVTGDQPVVISYEGDNGRPYKPCLTMRKVLILAWGHDGNAWAGRRIRLYCDPSVRFGKDEVGGVRISHLSHISADISVRLAATKGKKALYEIKRLHDDGAAALDAIRAAEDVDALKSAFAAAYRATRDDAARGELKAAYDARLASLGG